MAVITGRALIALQGAVESAAVRADALETAAAVGRQIETGLRRAETGVHFAALCELETRALAILRAVRPTPDELADLEIPAFLRRY